MVEGVEVEKAAVYGGEALTYCPSEAKRALNIVGCAAFSVAGLMIEVAGFGKSVPNMILGALCLAFFGGGGVALLIQFVVRLARRRPWLRVDSSGITGAYGGAFHVPWADVADIAIYRQHLTRGQSWYYLLVNVRIPQHLPRTVARSLNARFYPGMAQAGIIVPLNLLFVRASERKRAKLLCRIAAQFAPELAAYGILLDPIERAL